MKYAIIAVFVATTACTTAPTPEEKANQIIENLAIYEDVTENVVGEPH